MKRGDAGVWWVPIFFRPPFPARERKWHVCASGRISPTKRCRRSCAMQKIFSLFARDPIQRRAFRPPASGKTTSSTGFGLNFYVGREEHFLGIFLTFFSELPALSRSEPTRTLLNLRPALKQGTPTAAGTRAKADCATRSARGCAARAHTSTFLQE